MNSTTVLGLWAVHDRNVSRRFFVIGTRVCTSVRLPYILHLNYLMIFGKLIFHWYWKFNTQELINS